MQKRPIGVMFFETDVFDLDLDLNAYSGSEEEARRNDEWARFFGQTEIDCDGLTFENMEVGPIVHKAISQLLSEIRTDDTLMEYRHLYTNVEWFAVHFFVVAIKLLAASHNTSEKFVRASAAQMVDDIFEMCREFEEDEEDEAA